MLLLRLLSPRLRPFLRQISHDYSSGPRASPLDPAATTALRSWIASFRQTTLNKSKAGCDVRFDRSGGKGGQNVNKLNTKATLTVNLDQAHWISGSLLPLLSSSPYYAPSSNTLVITGSSQRTQAANLDECFDKLHAHLLGLALPLTPADTTQATRDRVKGHEARYKAKVKQDKMRRKDIKAGRSTKGKFD